MVKMEVFLMAGNKKVPLTWGVGGPIIGTATVDENGLIMAEIDESIAKSSGLYSGLSGISVYAKEDE